MFSRERWKDRLVSCGVTSRRDATSLTIPARSFFFKVFPSRSSRPNADEWNQPSTRVLHPSNIQGGIRVSPLSPSSVATAAGDGATVNSRYNRTTTHTHTHARTGSIIIKDQLFAFPSAFFQFFFRSGNISRKSRWKKERKKSPASLSGHITRRTRKKGENKETNNLLHLH